MALLSEVYFMPVRCSVRSGRVTGISPNGLRGDPRSRFLHNISVRYGFFETNWKLVVKLTVLSKVRVRSSLE